jgi:hypothetical protein
VQAKESHKENRDRAPLMSGQSHAPSALFPVKDPHTHWVGGRIGPRASLGVLEKTKYALHVPEIEPRTVQPLA